MNPVPDARAAALLLPLLHGCQHVFPPGEKGEPAPVVYGERSIVLQPGKHEDALFHWHPDYTQNVPGFDPENRPYIRSRTHRRDPTRFVHTLEEGDWVERSLLDAIRADYPHFRKTYKAAGPFCTRIVFDEAGHAYTAVQALREDRDPVNLLLYSRDHGRTWQTFRFPPGAFTLEHEAGPRLLEVPPAIAVWEAHTSHPARFASWHTLKVLLPRKTEDGLVLGEPITVSESFLGYSSHSGGGTRLITHNGRTHVIFGETTDRDLPGVPTYVRTLYRETGSRKRGRMDDKVFLAHAPPANDVHNDPALCLDGHGHLHAVTGAHGDNFYYLRSRAPDDASAWTDPVPTLEVGWRDDDGSQRGRQTYVALVCDHRDTLHLVFRQWRRGVDEHHPDPFYGALSYQRKTRRGAWEPAWPLVVPPVAGYSIYYHKLATDRDGRLYLSYSYWAKEPPYVDHKGEFRHRALLRSADGGETWHLPETEDFLRGIRRGSPRG